MSNLDAYSKIDRFALSDGQKQAIWDFFGGSCWQISDFLGDLLNIADSGCISQKDFEELLYKKLVSSRSMFVEYATIIPKKRVLLKEMANVVLKKRAFTVDDIAALVDQGVWQAEALIHELNSLVRKNFLSYAPPRAEYALQGRSMELGLEAYDKMLDQRTLKIPGRKKGAF